LLKHLPNILNPDLLKILMEIISLDIERLCCNSDIISKIKDKTIGRFEIALFKAALIRQ
jgi:hypothetical protein